MKMSTGGVVTIEMEESGSIYRLFFGLEVGEITYA